MILEMIKLNIGQEKKLVGELENLLVRSVSNARDQRLFQDAIISKSNQLKILNDSLPLLLKKVSFSKELPDNYSLKKIEKSVEVGKEIVTLTSPLDGSQDLVAIRKKDKDKYLEQLYISDSSIKSLRKGKRVDIEDYSKQYKTPSSYVSFANKLFLDTTNKMIEQGRFASLKKSLEKGNFVFLTQSYVSTIFLTTLIAFVISIFIFIFLFFFSISSSLPFIELISFSEANLLMRMLKFIWVIPVVPIAVFLMMYYYPSSEKASLTQKIDYELPFAAIQMAAVAGADIEPSHIFRIVSLSKEYPYIRKEAKKIMNQINLYGYDLINALRNVASASSSENWVDLLNGISTTLRSGGDLSKYLSKKAESLLFEYRLKREKAIKAAETFMDIYISVVIAAPMLMMLLLIMMSISGIGFAFSILTITVIVVSTVSLINMIFLVFLHLNQKKF